MSAANFAAYTRSTAFSVSLSAKMIDRVLSMWKMTEVASRYDWWAPPSSAFASGPNSTMATTDAALARRGLLDYATEYEPDSLDRPIVMLTEPGELMARLLVAAEFPIPRPRFGFGGGIEPHPDDCDDLGGRHTGRVVWLTNDDGQPVDLEIEPLELVRDRRLDMWQPGDEHYYGHMTITDRATLNEMVLDHERSQLAPSEPLQSG
jgi:hypothetical protein